MPVEIYKMKLPYQLQQTANFNFITFATIWMESCLVWQQIMFGNSEKGDSDEL